MTNNARNAARRRRRRRSGLTNALLAILLTLLLLVAGGTLAFYLQSSTVQNRLITKGSEVFLQELFNPGDLWLPGETKDKQVFFGNQGETDQVIRFKVTTGWFDNNGTPGNLADDTAWAYAGTYSPEPAVIHWGTAVAGPGAEWVRIGDWYYYTKVLEKQSGGAPTKTANVIESVTFSDAISNSGPGAADDFSDKRFSLEIQMESLDVSTLMTAEAWHMTFSQSGGALTWTAAP